MIKVLIVSALSDRKGLIDQMVESLNKSFGSEVSYTLATEPGMDKGEMATVNGLIDMCGTDWEYLVRTDDDMYFSKDWLEWMTLYYHLHPDVWLLGGCRYPTHEILEDRGDIYIMDICPGNHWLISRENYEKVGKFYEDFIDGQPEDVRYCRKIQEMGGKVACLKDPTLVVHCGIVGTNGKGRGDYVTGYSQALADVVGAKTNKIDS